jgi:predicted RNA-binding Zn ribbon-like protein
MELFERVGNALCLDFTNTVNQRPTPKRDLLDTLQGLQAWTAAAGLSTHAPLTSTDLARARVLREDIYTIFAAVVDGQPRPREPLERLLTAYARALPHATWFGLAAPPGNPSLHWQSDRAFANLAGPITDSALTLLRQGTLDRVRACPSCRWLFLDTSRNNKRRWCSMATCGSRSKSAMYFAKTRQTSSDVPRPEQG